MDKMAFLIKLKIKKFKLSIRGWYMPISLFIMLASCGTNSSKDNFENINNYTLEKVDELTIPLDSLTKRIHQISYFSDESDLFMIYNELVHSIYIYNINDSDDRVKIELNQEGPNGLDEVVSMYTQDGVHFTLLTNSQELVEVNAKGEVIKRKQFLSYANGDAALVNRPKIFKIMDDYYVSVRPSALSKKEKYTFLAKGSFDSNNIDYLFMYPKDLNYSDWSTMINEVKLAYIESNNHFVASMPFTEKLYSFNLENRRISEYKASSNIMTSPTPKTQFKGISNSRDFLLTNSWYLNLLYDKNNKTYYRYGNLGSDKVNGNYVSKNNQNLYHTILILDEKFRKIGEVTGLNLWGYSFINDGLLYTPNYKANPNSEDSFVFDIYELKSLESN